MTIGIRSNNPGNIRTSKTPWSGQTGVNEKGFVIFESPEYGIRAIAKILRTYRERYGLRTVGAIISRWAPANENDTLSYIRHACQRLGVEPDHEIDIHQPVVMVGLISAIIRHENGIQPYAPETIRRGIGLAMKKESTQ